MTIAAGLVWTFRGPIMEFVALGTTNPEAQADILRPWFVAGMLLVIGSGAIMLIIDPCDEEARS